MVVRIGREEVGHGIAGFGIVQAGLEQVVDSVVVAEEVVQTIADVSN